MPVESNSWRKDVSRAYALLRFTLGLNICLHGIVRWIAGSGNFAQPLVTTFQKTPLPACPSTDLALRSRPWKLLLGRLSP